MCCLSAVMFAQPVGRCFETLPDRTKYNLQLITWWSYLSAAYLFVYLPIGIDYQRSFQRKQPNWMKSCGEV